MSVRPFVAEQVGDVAAAHRVARAAAHRLGLDEPVLLRVGSNALFAAGPAVVLRVGRVTAPPAAALALSTLLAGAGIRVPTVHSAIDDLDDEYAVLAVERVTPSSQPIDWEAVGAAVRAVHHVDPASAAAVYPLPKCSVFGHWDFAAMFDDVAVELGAAERVAVRAAVDRLAGWQQAAELAPQVVCHGDVHPGNVLMTADGPVVIDWDMLCAGPAAWDHAALLTWEHRWGGDAGTYAGFARGYGTDLTDDPLAQLLAEGRLLAATLMRCRAGRRDPVAADEARRRLRYWLGDPDAPQWRAA
ncbi:MAG: phosphotransferase [Ilumatobacteraceae bacterium]